MPRELIYQPHSQLSQWLLLTALFQSWCMMRHLHTDSVVSEVDRRICGSLHRTKQSKHVICLHLDTLITAFLNRPPYLYACVLLHKNTMYGRFREMDEKGAYLFFYMQVCIFVCVCVHVWLYAWPIAEPCGIVKKKRLWFRFSLETERIPRNRSLGCPKKRLGQICGWWDRWDAACCFLTTWNAIYLSARPSRQREEIDRDKRAGKTDTD